MRDLWYPASVPRILATIEKIGYERKKQEKGLPSLRFCRSHDWVYRNHLCRSTKRLASASSPRRLIMRVNFSFKTHFESRRLFRFAQSRVRPREIQGRKQVTPKKFGNSYFADSRSNPGMISETRSLFGYDFVTFFCWWWGLALFALAWKATTSASGFLYSSYFVSGVILLLIGLYSIIMRARVLMEDRRAFAARTTISP
jgi:hypothetical protein